ncbi:MAG: flavin-dependent oxidoreductase [Alphaproteobacteria bacterium 64-6]|mgnify:CR=1 FL=1|nr:MAG: flavin-dependent oxidoreductase [Alphaproteobacteria bacterium 64-6]
MAVVIVGAGIGGLTLALSLHQVGIAARLYESVDKLEPLGVGINLLPHAVRELTELGLADEIAETAIPTSTLSYVSKRGQSIWSEPRGQAAGYNWPQFSIHRGELQMILYRAVLERLGPDAVRTGHHFSSFEQTGTGIRAEFVDRRSGAPREAAEGAVLVGCDGIHSALRAQLVPNEGPPKWNGAILWRGVTESTPYLDGRTMIMAGHERQKFVCYPISRRALDEGRALVNWIAELRYDPDHEWRREDWNRAGRLDEFLPHFESWQFGWLDVPGLIRGARACFEYPMVDRDPLPSWGSGRVTLLGDAAHPMYPIGSNGASQAILDARVLTREIRAHGLGSEALGAYAAERNPATARIVLANRANGPEQVMQLVEERAPQGYARIEDVLSLTELENAAAGYKRLAGFDRETLNSRPPIVAAG